MHGNIDFLRRPRGGIGVLRREKSHNRALLDSLYNDPLECISAFDAITVNPDPKTFILQTIHEFVHYL